MSNEELYNLIKKQNSELKKQLEERDNLLILLTKEIAQLKIELNEKVGKIDNKIETIIKNK